MSRSTSRAEELATLVRRANPEPDVPGASHELEPESRALLQRIMADTGPSTQGVQHPQRHRPRVWIPRLAIGMAILLTAAALVVGGRPSGPAVAATPPVLGYASAPREAGAVDQLRDIARRAEDIPNDVGTGPAAQLDYTTWSLFTRVDGVDTRSDVVQEKISKRIEPDGLRRIRTTLEGGDDTGRETNDEIAGGPAIRLGSTLPEVRKQLAIRNPAGPMGRFNAVVETLLESPATPAARAALIRYLAATPGIAARGKVQDRMGRQGAAFQISSDTSGLPTDYTLILDPATGAFLGYEELLTTDAGKLNVPVPSVISYIVWEDARFVS